MKVADYSDWRTAKLRSAKAVIDQEIEEGGNPMVDCGKCHGEGEITDTGLITGQEFDATCPDCDGDGQILASEAQESFEENLTFHDYEKELKADVQALASWTGRPAHLVLAECGFNVWSEISTKILRCSLIYPATRIHH